MKTFVIHAPEPTDGRGNRSFDDTLATCTGEAFAISRSVYADIDAGMPLIILDKKRRKQAEAIITGLKFTSVAANGIRRYDVLFLNPRLVEYTGENIALNRCGVAFLDR